MGRQDDAAAAVALYTFLVNGGSAAAVFYWIVINDGNLHLSYYLVAGLHSFVVLVAFCLVCNVLCLSGKPVPRVWVYLLALVLLPEIALYTYVCVFVLDIQTPLGIAVLVAFVLRTIGNIACMSVLELSSRRDGSDTKGFVHSNIDEPMTPLDIRPAWQVGTLRTQDGSAALKATHPALVARGEMIEWQVPRNQGLLYASYATMPPQTPYFTPPAPYYYTPGPVSVPRRLALPDFSPRSNQ